MIRALTLISCIATPVLADEPMTGEQFDRYTQGRTYTYGHPGQTPYGIEAYLPNRQVIWAYFSDECVEGYWYDTPNNEICFVYPFDEEHKCWHFYKEGDILRGDFVTDPAEVDYEVVQTSQSMPCQAPFIGA